jgi:hypothetical protein
MTLEKHGCQDIRLTETLKKTNVLAKPIQATCFQGAPQPPIHKAYNLRGALQVVHDHVFLADFIKFDDSSFDCADSGATSSKKRSMNCLSFVCRMNMPLKDQRRHDIYQLVHVTDKKS